MGSFKITATCETGHVQTITYEGASLAEVQLYAGILDGTSPAYLFPPGPESVIGKCCWNGCGKPFKCTVEKPELPTLTSVDKLCTDPRDPRLKQIRPNGQQEAYLVLSDEERAKGFVRPVRQKYKHVKCGTVTTMGLAIAETYSRNPKFYGGTFCCACGSHFPLTEINGDWTPGMPPEQSILHNFLWEPDGSPVGS